MGIGRTKVEIDGEYIYGYRMSQLDDVLWQSGISTLDFSLVNWLCNKGEIDKTGNIIGKKYNLAHVKETIKGGCFEVTTHDYIFISSEDAKALIKDIKQEV